MDDSREKILAELILKIRFGTATKGEKLEVEKWLAEKEEHRFLYEKIVSGKSVNEYLEREAEVKARIDMNTISARISERVRKTETRKQRRFLGWYMVVGAACLVGIVLGGWLFFNSGGEKFIPVAENTPMEIVKEKVVLVLSDGQRIGLVEGKVDSINQEQAAIIKKEDRLIYEKKADSLFVPVKEERNRIITGVGGDYSFVLSDGTKVWLNAESELDFPVNFLGEERVVKLKGEAYFEVRKDEKHPFIVETKEVRTRVLGTSFNIKAYDNEESVFATLLTGKIEVAGMGSDSIVLLPNMQAEWQKKNHEMKVKQVEADHFVEWKQGNFVFDNEDISIVLRVLERWYGVKFIHENQGGREHTFSGSLSKDDKLEMILETLAFTGGPQFRVEGNTVFVRDSN